MGEDFIDGYASREVQAMGNVEGGNATNMQCLMWACDEHEGKIPYDYWYKCRFDMNVGISFPLVLVWLLFWFLLMGVIADGYLVPALVKIGRGLRMSDALLGATLLALGGAANDFMVGIASALKNVKKANKAHKAGEDEVDLEDLLMWLGGVFGTGFFINTLVAAMVMIFAPAEGIPVIPGVVTRDICFRMLAVATMLVFGWFGTIRWYTACLMILMYLVYVALTLRDASNRKATNESETNADAVSTQGGSCARLSRGSVASFSMHGQLDAVAPASNVVDAVASFRGEEHFGDRIKRHMGYDPDGGVLDKAGFIAALPIRWAFALTMATDTWDPIVNPLMPLCISIFIPYASFDLMVSIIGNEEMMQENFRTEQKYFAVIGLLLSGVVFLLQMHAVSKGSESDQLSGRCGSLFRSTTYILPMTYSWVTFLTCVLWLALIANEVLDCLGCIADMFNVPTMIAGITMLAWGNCVDNVFATIGLAKAGEFGVAITGIYAAPMFNVLFGTGITLLMISLMKFDEQCEFPMSNEAVIMLCTLLIILASTLLFTKLNGWKMTRTLGAALAILYPTVLIAAFAMGPKFPTKYSPLDI
jgi:sodium/potassium/calcium exchanger 6